MVELSDGYENKNEKNWDNNFLKFDKVFLVLEFYLFREKKIVWLVDYIRLSSVKYGNM